MAHAFDGLGFGQFLLDAERLLSGVREHEQRLGSLMAVLEGESSQTGPVTSPIDRDAMGVLAMVGRLRQDAGYRQLAEMLLSRLVGHCRSLTALDRRGSASWWWTIQRAVAR